MTKTFIFCNDCISEAKGLKKSVRTCLIEEEIEWLSNHLKMIREKRKDMAGLQIFQYPIQERLEKLKVQFAKEKHG